VGDASAAAAVCAQAGGVLDTHSGAHGGGGGGVATHVERDIVPKPLSWRRAAA